MYAEDDLLRRMLTLAAGRPASEAYLHLEVAKAALLRAHDYDRAIGELDRALRLRPRCPEARLDRGLAYLLKAAHLRPYLNQGWREIVPALVRYVRHSDLDRAIEDLTEAIALAPNDPRPYLARGLAYARRGGRAGRSLAHADLVRARDLAPQDPIAADALHELGTPAAQLDVR